MSNDFLPFAVGGAANVETQSDYVADTSTLQNGFQSGVANSSKLNKVWRQSSIMAAVLGQFIANTTGKNAVDDGTTATLLANLIAAVSATSPVVVGSARNLAMSVTAASATATLTADQIVVASALNGQTYMLPSFSKTINLATTGVGGMDTGTAPVSGFVALYAIWNPTTATAALLATNATAVAAPNVYGGANMPAGYTASALVSVWPTNGSGQLKVGSQRGRRVSTAFLQAVSTSSPPSSFTALSISGVVPPNAITAMGELIAGSTTAGNVTLSAAASVAGFGQQSAQGSLVTVALSNFIIDLITPQTIYWLGSVTSGTPTMIIGISAYEI